MDQGLALAGLGALTQCSVISHDSYLQKKHKGSCIGKLDMSTLFQMCHTSVSTPVTSVISEEKHRCCLFKVVNKKALGGLQIFVKTMNGQTITILCDKCSTIRDVKETLYRSGVVGRPDEQRLICGLKQLEDNQMLSDYNICADCTLYSVFRLQGGGISTYFTNELDREWDFDFTNIHEHKKFKRGGLEYKRPYGWYRYAIKVLGKYGDDAWLGSPGRRTKSDEAEWPVSYHGTMMSRAVKIVGGHYDINKQERSQYGPGIYSTPDVEIAATYAKTFTYKGKTYQMVLQNRVDPSALSVHGINGEIFIVPNGKHIRAYGILIRKCKEDDESSDDSNDDSSDDSSDGSSDDSSDDSSDGSNDEDEESNGSNSNFK